MKFHNFTSSNKKMKERRKKSKKAEGKREAPIHKLTMATEKTSISEKLI